ncbi:hypothetical protein CCMSSC00406_0002299 [Pleurotus cornucopiae]|uniref:Uncharacterized protein n=1 Tax=Pleurotus cornucopiae TaxID=5321 RepID=A0ACB7J3G4_PLECO|nr:hypothetical protein CCMSSC00406_0002299 [Pleurotus cornucopiae]
MSSPFSPTKRQFLILGGIITVLFATLLWQYPKQEKSTYLGAEYGQSSWLQKLCPQSPAPNVSTLQTNFDRQRLRRKNIAIASTFGFHHDVFLALAWTMKRVLGAAGGAVQVYARTPYAFGFQEIVDELGLYTGPVKTPEELVQDITRNNGEGSIDLVVLGTCEVDLRGDWHEQLLAAWDARDGDHKFQLICIVHHVLDTAWQPRIAEWSRRDAIRLLPISNHVAQGFRRSFNELADSKDPKIRSAGYEYIPIDVHVPILDVPRLPQTLADKVLSKAVIQGSFNMDRRDYAHLFEDLKDSLAESPRSWGYLPLHDRDSYVIDPEDPSPFHLYLIGSGHVDVPTELKNIVSVHVNLEYSAFYELMGSMDICIPAFAENGYYEHQASSTFAMSLECDVPILVTHRMRASYTYADDDRVVVTRPAAMREIAAIKALRTWKVEDESPNLQTKKAIQEMMSRGWTRSKREMQLFKEEIWMRNENVVQRILAQ